MNKYQVIEREYSWGTLVQLFRNWQLVMFVDVYKDGTYRVVQGSEWLQQV